MKKILSKILCIVLMLSSLLSVAVGCGGNGDQGDRNEDIVAIYNTYVAYAESNGETPLSYEAWLASIKGEKGDTGATGPEGPEGAPGAPGEPGAPGWNLRTWRRHLCVRHGQPGQDRYTGAEHDPAEWIKTGCGYQNRIYRPSSGRKVI